MSGADFTHPETTDSIAVYTASILALAATLAKQELPTNPVTGHVYRDDSVTPPRFLVWNTLQSSAWAVLPIQQGLWIDCGQVPTRTSGTAFTVPGNATALFTTDARVKVQTASTTWDGKVASSSFSSVTTVNLILDSGSLSGTLTNALVSVVDTAWNAIPPAPIAKVPSLVQLGAVLSSLVTSSSNSTPGSFTQGALYALTGSAPAWTLPAANATAQWPLAFFNAGTGVATLTAGSGDTIGSAASLRLYPGEGAILLTDGSHTLRNTQNIASRVAVPSVARSSNFPVDAVKDRGVLQKIGANLTLTLLTAAALGDGWALPITITGAFTATINVAGGSGDTIAGASTYSLSGADNGLTLVSDGVSAFRILANASASPPVTKAQARRIAVAATLIFGA